MKTKSKQRDISQNLQIYFLFSTLLCLFIGIVGLYTWNKQRSEITFAIDQDFPKVRAAFQAVEQINLIHNTFNTLSNTKNRNERIEQLPIIDSRLKELENSIIELGDNVDIELLEAPKNLSTLSQKLSDNIAQTHLLNDQLNKVLATINWLHDDFQNEFTALVQEINWQQSSLSNTITNNEKEKRQIELVKSLQQALQIIYELIGYEDQIVTELKAQIAGNSNYSMIMFDNYMNYLKLLIDSKIKQLNIHSSTHAIEQIMTDLLIIGIDKKSLPNLLETRKQLMQERKYLITQNDILLLNLRENVSEQVGNSQKQQQIIHNIIDKSAQIGGLIILIAMIIACVFTAIVIFFYIKKRLLKRFQLLNHSVDKLTRGQLNVKIPVYGNDELGRIAKLLRLFLFEINRTNHELNARNQILLNEIQDRIKIQNELETTQNELIQTAKLAVVGQTLTTISHEINQPLNAMSAYVFSGKKALNNQDIDSVHLYFDKINHLVKRTELIIKRLRQFSRKRESTQQAINLTETINNAWALLEPKHKSLQAKLNYPISLPFVIGDEILFQQVFVNIFLNALEAAIEGTSPQITIQLVKQSDHQITLFIIDNGQGWPLTNQLLQPFSSSKSINLGLGLSISHSIMKQYNGSLRIASTLDKHALIILTFNTVKKSDKKGD